MIVNLIRAERMFSLTLPKKIKGQYWLTDVDENGEVRQLVSIEASQGQWHVRGNRRVSVLDGTACVADYKLTADTFLYLKMADSDEKVILFTEEIDQTRQTLSKIIVTEGAVFNIGREADNHFCFRNDFVSGHHARLMFDGENWSIQDLDSRNGTFVNGLRVSSCVLKAGDFVYIMGLKIVIGSNYFAINNPDLKLKIKSESLVLYHAPAATAGAGEEMPDKAYFFRSPRFHREVEHQQLKIDPPPQLQKLDTVPMALMLGPSLTMAMTSVGTGILSFTNVMANSGDIMQALPSIIMSVSMLGGTVLWPVLTKRYEKKEKLRAERDRQQKYLAYLSDVSDSIRKIGQVQSDIINENLIPLDECTQRIIRRKASLWERGISQPDFLRLRLGTGIRPMDLEVKFQEQSFSMEEDTLKNAMMALADEPKKLDDVPVSLALTATAAVGIYGERENRTDLLLSLVLQMTALHSYDELKIILITDKSQEADWKFAGCLPHLWNDTKTTRFYADSADDIREISSFLEREVLVREDKKPDDLSAAVPYYVCLVTSTALAKKCGALHKILQKKNNIGFTAVFTGKTFSDLPKETRLVIHAAGENSKFFDREDTCGREISFRQDEVNRSVFENISRTLANIQLDLESRSYVLPSMLTFLEMFHVGKTEHLNSLARWKENNPTKSLQTPVGVGEDGDLLMLDLHEKFHGPHGLVAGMTGSGKSEFIITYILSMAVNYHPDEVSFILIDYKGGGLAGAFENPDRGIRLPHLAGTITNLDGAAITRSLVSIQSELRRRQGIFNQARKLSNEGTMDIYKYQQMYRDKIVTEPMPHLFIISDEFAELKTQQPEFMDQLVSAARIGRSLGVHLILATQKPSGVVDDQIWSNSKFRVCLKVQEQADSQEMIKCSDAAELSQTGRFYLQVGFNELFALGQSAWCGGEYQPMDEVKKTVDSSVQVVDNTGRVLMNVKPDKQQKVQSGMKQIVAVVKYLSDLAQEEHVGARALWLDPIPGFIYLDELEEKYPAETEAFVLNPAVGEYDDPFNQKQGILRVPLSQDGSCLVFGATGNGKTTFLTTLCCDLIRHHSPEELNLYIMDYGSETLRAFEGAPQCGGVVTSSDEEKARNLIKMLRQEMERRKNLFSEFGGDYASYIRSGEASVPNIVVVINNYSGFAEQFEDLEEEIVLLTRDGLKFGIYFVVSASGTNSIRYKLQQNFKTQLTMQLNDATDYTVIVGKTDGLVPSRFKGRGLVKLDKVYEFQTAYCSREEDAQDYLRSLCRELASAAGTSAKAIPVLPEVVDADFVAPEAGNLDRVPVGVGKQSLEILSVNLRKAVILPIMTQDLGEMEQFAAGLTEVLGRIQTIHVFDAEKLLKHPGTEVQTGDFSASVVSLFGEMVTRNNTYKDAGLDESVLDAFPQQVHVIIGVKRFFDQLDQDGREKMSILLEKAQAIYKIHFVMLDSLTQFNSFSYETWFKTHVSDADGVWAGDGVADQYALKISKVTANLYDEVGSAYGYLISRGRPVLAKLVSGSGEEV